MSQIYAHRGATDGPRENTLEAFTRAVALGCDGVELDVHRTADGVVVVHHDATIAGIGEIPSLEAAQLPAYVPTLQAVFGATGSLRVNVEVKVETAISEDALEILAAAVLDEVKLAGAVDRVWYSSFHRPALEMLRSLDAEAPLGWLLTLGAPILERLDLAVASGYQALHPWVLDVDAQVVSAVHAAGLGLHTWTVNGPGDLEVMLALGVDGIITDVPALALSLREAQRS